MKALLSKAVGGPETLVLEEVPDPVAGPGQILVAVKACSINYPDVLIIEDKYQFKPPRPFAPGGEISGVVEAVGEGVTKWKPGDRVLSTTGNGGLVEKIVLGEGQAFALPPERSFEEGASLLLTYGTTIHALLDRVSLPLFPPRKKRRPPRRPERMRQFSMARRLSTRNNPRPLPTPSRQSLAPMVPM